MQNNKLLNIVKRDGSTVAFEADKIRHSVSAAFQSVGKELTDEDFDSIYGHLKLHDGISVEEIQDQVSTALMQGGFYEVAKSYILYREKHREARLVREKIDYITRYSKSKENAASNSNTDANANNSVKNVSSIEAEVFKDKNRLIQRQMMKDKLNVMFPEVAKQYAKDIEHHTLYVHDESSSAIQKAYCGAYTLYPLMTEGVGNIDNITPCPPNDIQSFSGQVTNLVFALSAQSKGAVALGDYMIALNYYVVKEFGSNYYEKLDSIMCNSNVVDWQKYTIRRDIRKAFKQFIYGINQPAGNRGFQCVTEDTELWTPNGFKKFSELKAGDLCYTYRNGKFQVEPILALTVKDFDGDLLQFCSRDYQQTVTPEHRVLNYKTNSDELRLTPASELFNKTAIRVPVSGVLEKEDYNISDAGIKLLAALYTDGSFDYQEGHGDARTTFYVSTKRNGYHILKESLEIEQIGYSEYESKASIKNVAVIRPEKKSIRKFASLIDYNKKDIADILFEFSPKQLRMFFDTWAQFDGQTRNKDNSRLMLQCDNELIADKIQRLALQAGFNSKIDYRYRKANGVFKESYTRYVIIYKSTDKRSITHYKKVPYKGKVWCPSTNAGIVVFREKNKMPYITGNCPFTNINIFDKYYFQTMFGDFYYPDGTQPQWEAIDALQRIFVELLREIRLLKPVTFPVVTIALLYDENGYKDKEYADFCAEEWAKGSSHFLYHSDNANAISSCCRVSNKITENTFSSTTGMTGVMTGSCNVITLNINRIIQDCDKAFGIRQHGGWTENTSFIKDYLQDILKRVYKYHIAYKTMLYELEDEGMITYSNAGYLYIKKLYSTVGVLGYYEAAKFLGLEDNSEEYKRFMAFIMKTISDYNKKNSIHDKKRPFVFNLEAVPGENLAVKLYNWDKADGYVVPEDQNLYNCYFFNPWKEENILNKIKLHGGEISKASDGGQGCHLNLSDHLSKSQYLKVMDVARHEKCNYFTFNIPMSECEDCHHVVNGPIKECPICHSKRISYYTRIIGFLVKVSNWSKERQKEFTKRYFGNA